MCTEEQYDVQYKLHCNAHVQQCTFVKIERLLALRDKLHTIPNRTQFVCLWHMCRSMNKFHHVNEAFYNILIRERSYAQVSNKSNLGCLATTARPWSTVTPNDMMSSAHQDPKTCNNLLDHVTSRQRFGAKADLFIRHTYVYYSSIVHA